MMSVETRLDPYEIDGSERDGLPKTENLLVISDHRNNRFVVLTLGNRSITVSADELNKAIQNATNH